MSSVLVAAYDSNSLDEHVAVIQRQVDRSLQDPQTHRLARKIMTGRPDGHVRGPKRDWPVVQQWGDWYYLPELGAAGDGWREQIRRIWDFVVLNVRYEPDPNGFDLFSTLRYTLSAAEGDCDDMVIAFAALLRPLGYDVRGRVISVNGKNWEHIYALVQVPRVHSRYWLPLDTTVPHAVPGWEYEHIRDVRDFDL